MNQAWVPTVTEHVYQTHCWFLSAIIPLWMVHEVVLERIKRWWDWALWALLALLTFLPWFGLVVLPPLLEEPVGWYRQHDPERRENRMTALDVWVVLLKFNPLFFVITYLYGMVSAILFVRYRVNPPFLFRYGASLGYVSLYLIFGLVGGQLFPAGKLSARLGALGRNLNLNLNVDPSLNLKLNLEPESEPGNRT